MAHTPAQAAALALARVYLEQGDDKHALRMLRAATLGKSPNVAALVLQVSCFLSPQTVSRQHAPSSIFKQRRDASTDALINYYHSLVQAQCLMQGRGTPRDARAALDLFRRAAAAGRGIEAGREAAWELGRLLLDVCARSLPPLSVYLSRACSCQVLLLELELELEALTVGLQGDSSADIEADASEGVRWIEAAATAGHVHAARTAARLYRTGQVLISFDG